MGHDVYNIFWTAGWDSTFRVVDLVLIRKQTVQPYYVIDRKRKSNEIEQERIEKMKQMMIDIDSGVEERLLPVKKIYKDEIPKNETIRKQFYDLRNSGGFIGSQYVFLSSYAHHLGVDDMEMCVHKDDKAHDYLQNDVEKYDDSVGENYRIKDELSNDNLKIFSYFRFPLFEMTKIEMQEYAVVNGFAHIMDETWFCHQPYKGDTPCGLCNPCIYTREEGLAQRVPEPSFFRKAKYNTRINSLKFLSKVKRTIIKS